MVLEKFRKNFKIIFMALYTSSYLKQLSAGTIASVKNRLFTESRNLSTGFDIFLSHSFLDKEEVEGIYIELTNKGYSVYVDWIVDAHLDRKNVTKATAEHIRNRMKSSKSLLLALSTSAQLSKWIPWELGFIDGDKSQCALFPVSREGGTAPTVFNRSEYLLLYPYVKMADIDNRKELFVTESSNEYSGLNDWVRRKVKPNYQFRNIDFL
jgi:hypothetical protein